MQVVGWKRLTAAYAVLIAALSVWPFSSDVARIIGPLDKLLHVCEYALLAWCLVQALRSPTRPGVRLFAAAFLLSTAYGALLEVVQGWLPYRSAEGGDLIANAAGAGLGALAAGLMGRDSVRS